MVYHPHHHAHDSGYYSHKDNACNEQKKIILDMVVDKKLNGEDVDANIVAQLSKACGKDLINIDALDEE